MNLPYRILFGFLLSGVTVFALSPWLALQSIERAVKENDAKRWPELIREAGLAEYAGAMLVTMLDLKMYAEMTNDPREAMRDNRLSKRQVAKTAGQLAAPGGFRHLLCGELSRDLKEELPVESGCWMLNGHLSWESPTQVRVVFKNPETDWQSSLIMERNGLFSWQAVAVELPIDAILDRFAESVGLKPLESDSV